MLVHSFAFENRRPIPVEVELTLWPGLPSIQFVGLPDQQIKESAWRIKSAIKSQGFDFPKAQQILVNLRPNSLKKSSQGIELAVAMAFLMESEQIPVPSSEVLKDLFIYGSLTLAGEVNSTQDLNLLKRINAHSQLVTGSLPQLQQNPRMKFASISNLQALKEILIFNDPRKELSVTRPEFDEFLCWSEREVEFLQIAATGGHHALLAGPSGCGKTTMAKLIHKILPEPKEEEDTDCLQARSGWLALAQPHHSVTLRGLIGGGADVNEGEVTRAHGGVLLLDEFLEFRAEAIEALREPLEEGVVHLARGSKSLTLPAKFQLLATTNLCPCGRWTPGIKKSYCRFTLKKCKSYGERMSGPLLDRFQILHFVFNQWESKREIRSTTTKTLIEKIEKATDFRRSRGQKKKNAELTLEELQSTDSSIIRANLLPETLGSERRRLATLRVARTFADLSGEIRIRPEDLQKALRYTYINFQSISRWD